MTETKPTKQTYRIRNWAEYNAALIQRGSFTLWLDEAMIERWHNAEKSSRRGASSTYSDLAIQCALTLKAVYRLPLRATQGFLSSRLAPDASAPDDPALQHLLPQTADAGGVHSPHAEHRGAPSGGGLHGSEGLWWRRVEGAPARLQQAADLAQAACRGG